MKKYIFVLITLLCISPSTLPAYSQWFPKETTIIDVRTLGEFEAGHLKNSLNIPYDQISAHIAAYVKDKDAPIMVYCRSGRRSGIAQDILTRGGYNNVINGGGYSTLKELEP